MLQRSELREALKTITDPAKKRLRAPHGPWTRAVAFKHLYKANPEPLYGGGAKTNGARFTPKARQNRPCFFDPSTVTDHPNPSA